MKLSVSNCHHRTYARQGSQIWFSKIYCEKSLGGRILSRHISNKIFTQILCGQQLLPSTYSDLHSARSFLPCEKTINRDAKHSMKNLNLSIGSARLCVFCQRKVPAQCRGRCCWQHLLGGLPISATL